MRYLTTVKYYRNNEQHEEYLHDCILPSEIPLHWGIEAVIYALSKTTRLYSQKQHFNSQNTGLAGLLPPLLVCLLGKAGKIFFMLHTS